MTGSISRVSLDRSTSSKHSVRGIDLEDTNGICSEVWYDKIFSGGVCQDIVWMGFFLSFCHRARGCQDEFLSLDNPGAGRQRQFVRGKCREVTVMEFQQISLETQVVHYLLFDCRKETFAI